MLGLRPPTPHHLLQQHSALPSCKQEKKKRERKKEKVSNAKLRLAQQTGTGHLPAPTVHIDAQPQEHRCTEQLHTHGALSLPVLYGTQYRHLSGTHHTESAHAPQTLASPPITGDARLPRACAEPLLRRLGPPVEGAGSRGDSECRERATSAPFFFLAEFLWVLQSVGECSCLRRCQHTPCFLHTPESY